MSILSELSSVMVALAFLLALLGVFAAMALFARNYIKVPPSQVAIFYGRKQQIVDERGTRATVGFRVVRPRTRTGRGLDRVNHPERRDTS